MISSRTIKRRVRKQISDPLPLVAQTAIGKIISVDYDGDLDEALACASDIADKAGWTGRQVIQYIEMVREERRAEERALLAEIGAKYCQEAQEDEVKK